jgi:MFS family permease
MWSLRPNASCTTTIPGRGLCLKYEIGHMLARGGGGSIVFTSSATSLRASALLSGAIATPVLGRLADGRRRKRTMIVTLALILAGNILAALAGQFAMLLVGRAVQGIGLGLIRWRWRWPGPTCPSSGPGPPSPCSRSPPRPGSGWATR